MKKLFFFLIFALTLSSCGKEKKFDQQFTEAVDIALETAVLSEDVCNQTKSAWSKAIYDNRDPEGHYCSDFNYALRVLYKQIDEQGIYDKINNKKRELNNIARELSECPNSRKDAYNELVDFITDINAFAKLATDPSGSLQSYNSEVRDLDNSISKQYDTFKIKYSYIFENGNKK